MLAYFSVYKHLESVREAQHTYLWGSSCMKVGKYEMLGKKNIIFYSLSGCS